jgi:RNA polymerase sigma factor (sigma-70 family)
MDSVASRPATAAPPTGGTAVTSLSPGLRCYSKNVASQHNNVADPPAGGKAAWFEREVTPLREPLYLHALRMCHNHADAEDLVQDTMVKAYSNFDSFLPDSNLKAWLYRIQTNTYINTYRRRRRRPVQYSTDAITDQSWRPRHNAHRRDTFRPKIRLWRHCPTPKSWRRCSPCQSNSARWCTTPMSRGSAIGRSPTSWVPHTEL